MVISVSVIIPILELLMLRHFELLPSDSPIQLPRIASLLWITWLLKDVAQAVIPITKAFWGDTLTSLASKAVLRDIESAGYILRMLLWFSFHKQFAEASPTPPSLRTPEGLSTARIDFPLGIEYKPVVLRAFLPRRLPSLMKVRTHGCTD